MVEESNEERKVNLDLLDKVSEEARIKAEALKRRVEYKYSSKLRPRQFQVADLVMRKAHPYQLENKLSPNWAGPFRVTEVLGNGAYRLEKLEGDAIPRTWNVFRPVDLGRLRARPQPSARDSFPLVTCEFLQRRTKGRPSGRLHSDAQVNQKETPKTMHLRIGAPCAAL